MVCTFRPRLKAASAVRSVARRLAGVLSPSRAAGADAPPELEVRLLVARDAPAPSDAVDAILALLRRAGRMRLDALVRDGAEMLYRSELVRGGANVDLGFFGPGVFVPAICGALNAGHGRLWEIAAPVDVAHTVSAGAAR